jgi:hypothetical protein
MVKHCMISILLILGMVSIAGCSNQTTAVTDYASLIQHLNKSGGIFEPKGSTEQPSFPEVFSGTSKLIKLDGENLNIWEYGEEATAIMESKFVKFNGYDIYEPPSANDKGFGGTIDWIAQPHWYQTGKIIVLYVGEKQGTLDLLAGLLNPYYAGPGIEPPPVTDYPSFIDNLLWNGALVKIIGNEAFQGIQSIFSGTGKRIELNNENISILDYEDETTAAKEAKFISTDGFRFESENGREIVNISWIAPPHFYQSGSIIVLYVGEKQETLDLLKSLLGSPFAGAK